MFRIIRTNQTRELCALERPGAPRRYRVDVPALKARQNAALARMRRVEPLKQINDYDYVDDNESSYRPPDSRVPLE